jgi:hypothetical protein
MSNPYFKGMQIKSRTRKELPSKKATHLNLE